MNSKIETAKAIFRAYAESDRETAEALIADDFRFTSPYDNRIDRKTYFDRCWPNHASIVEMTFLRAIAHEEEVVVTYEGKTNKGKKFRNTEVLTVKDDKLVCAEVYFGWNVPHVAAAGSFIDPE